MIKLLYIDLFSGAGGTTTGIEAAEARGMKCAKVIACVNHDANAIASHAANHPDSLHFTEDIRTLDLTKLIAHTQRMRIIYPDALLVIWASLECTNFSKAKGGQPRDADSRTLAEHLFRYIEGLNPDFIQIENVEEFMSWGPLDEAGKPVSRSCGIDYMRWIKHISRYGYAFDWRILNSADFGAYTSRKRYFAQFAKNGLPMAWPEPTHTKVPTSGTMFKNEVLHKYKPVREVLDLTDEGESIFTPGKISSEKTRERIYAGLIKFVAGGKDSFLVKYNSMSQSGKYVAPDIDQPSPVVSTQNRLGIAKVSFLSKYYSGKPEHKNISVEQPAGTITTIDSHALVTVESANITNDVKIICDCGNSWVSSIENYKKKPCDKCGRFGGCVTFLSAYYGNGDNVSSVDGPAPTVTTKDRLSVIQPKFLNSYNYKDEPKDIDNPCPTLTTKDRFGVVSPKFIDQQFGQSKPASIDIPCNSITGNPKFNLVSCKPFIMNNYSGGGQHSDVENPSPVVTSVPKSNLITCKPWVMDTQFSNVGSSIEDTLGVITANRKFHYLMNPQYFNNGSSIENPCFTLIARMDKMPPYLIVSETGQAAIEVYESDTEMERKIKEFMAMYGIIDIKMRMLRIPELKRIMGFPTDYKLIGTQAEQKKFIGNAVEVNTARVICSALADTLHEMSLAV